MKKYLGLLVAVICFQLVSGQDSLPKSPDQLYGELFAEVQKAKLFPDSKTFADVLPKKDPAAILSDYRKAVQKSGADFSLSGFIQENFQLPSGRDSVFRSASDISLENHIQESWKLLRKKPALLPPGASLVNLPFPYLVAGGRWQELHYWDTYFVLIGLKEIREFEWMEELVDDVAFLIDSFGYVPAGNRTYFLSHSEPPFFSLMVELLASLKGDQVMAQYLPQLEKEYGFWMKGAATLKKGQRTKRVVRMPDGTILNRYWDERQAPRAEWFREDLERAETAGLPRGRFYQEARAASESGWIRSSRWKADKKNAVGPEVTEFIPVDLNSLLLGLENTLARACKIKGQDSLSQEYELAAENRQKAMEKYCWNQDLRFFTDYNLKTGKASGFISPAGLYPFVFFSHRQGYLSLLARQAATVVRDSLLQAGGLATSTQMSGMAWDSPYGWAPLQWMAIHGLARAGQLGLAKDIAVRWININQEVYKGCGRMLEKYQVTDPAVSIKDGQSNSFQRYAWSNGVYLALRNWLKQYQ